jgi:hypothetical protein
MKPIFPSSSGARPALLMGVDPEAMLNFFFEFRLKSVFLFLVFRCHNLHKTILNSPFLLDLYISSGARPALPMGVAPKAMVGFLEAIIGSKIL